MNLRILVDVIRIKGGNKQRASRPTKGRSTCSLSLCHVMSRMHSMKAFTGAFKSALFQDHLWKGIRAFLL